MTPLSFLAAGTACQEAMLLHLGLRCGRFIFGFHSVQSGYLILDVVDAVAPCLVLGVQLVGVVGQWLACCLCLGVLDGFVVVAAKLRFQC